MGCENTKEKLEDQMMKMKMARIEVQMERFKSLQLLKDMDGTELKTPIIPDYIDKDFLLQNEKNSSTTLNQDNSPTNRNKTRRSKSFALKRKTVKLQNENEGMKKRRRTVYKKNSQSLIYYFL